MKFVDEITHFVFLCPDLSAGVEGKCHVQILIISGASQIFTFSIIISVQ